jgi:hypothetical protein
VGFIYFTFIFLEQMEENSWDFSGLLSWSVKLLSEILGVHYAQV